MVDREQTLALTLTLILILILSQIWPLNELITFTQYYFHFVAMDDTTMTLPVD